MPKLNYIYAISCNVI